MNLVQIPPNKVVEIFSAYLQEHPDEARKMLRSLITYSHAKLECSDAAIETLNYASGSKVKVLDEHAKILLPKFQHLVMN